MKKINVHFLLDLDEFSEAVNFESLKVINKIIEDLYSHDKSIKPSLYLIFKNKNTSVDHIKNTLKYHNPHEVTVFNIAQNAGAGVTRNITKRSKNEALRSRGLTKCLALARYAEEILSQDDNKEDAQYLVVDVTGVNIFSGKLIAKDIPIDHCLSDEYIYLSSTRLNRVGPTTDWIIVGKKMLTEFRGLHKYIENKNHNSRIISYALPRSLMPKIIYSTDEFARKITNAFANLRNLREEFIEVIKKRLTRETFFKKIERKIFLALFFALEKPKLIAGISAVNAKICTISADHLHSGDLGGAMFLAFLQEKSLSGRIRLVTRRDFVLGGQR